MLKCLALIVALWSVPCFAIGADDVKTRLPGDKIIGQQTVDLKTTRPDDEILGQQTAKITLIEYASLSCPHCAQFHMTVFPVIQMNYIKTGKARFVFRDFPLNGPALIGAQLAHCAAKQGGDAQYFAALNVMFFHQKSWAFAVDYKDRALNLLQGVGLNRQELALCLNDKTIENRVLNSRLDAAKHLKIEATPAFLLNGEKIDDMHTAEEVTQHFDAVLQK